jgi:hypothetical protein
MSSLATVAVAFMETLTLRSIQQPSTADLWLHEIVSDLGILPAGAAEILSTASTSSALRRIIKMAKNLGKSCSAWRDDQQRFWLFVGELSIPSRERDCPVLMVDQYGEDGQIVATSMWVRSAGMWERQVGELSADQDQNAP